MFIWDVSTKKQLAAAKTVNGTPPATYGVVWSHHQDRILAYGVNYIKFWRLQRGPKGSGTLQLSSADAGSFGTYTPHTITSAIFLPSGTVLTGAPDGMISSWVGPKCVARRGAHGAGPEVRRPDGSPTRHGVRCMVLRRDGATLLTCGADGMVKGWDVR